MLKKFHEREGFTLIELLIVIAIIGILAAIAIPNFLAYRTKGQDAAAISAAKNFYNMAMAYYADGHDGTLSPDPEDDQHLPNYNPGPEVVASGSITVDDAGDIEVDDLTFQHQNSGNSYILTAEGDVSEVTSE